MKRQSKNYGKGKVKREQPRKDNRTKRVNFDIERVSKFEEMGDETKKTSKSNDVTWYAKNVELLRSAASLPFSTTTGMQLPFGSSAMPSVPGVMSLTWNMSIGGVNNDAINAAANSLYSYVVHANSRNTKYNAPDLMQVIIEGAHVFSAIAHAIRAYGTMKRFDQRNSYLPIGLIAAMGFDYSDLQANLSQMWFDINEIIARATQIWIPNDIPVLQRWFWMNSNIYMDAASIKSQYYVFTPGSFYGYDETYNDNGGALSLIPDDAASETQIKPFTMKAGSNHTWAEYVTLLNTMIGSLLNSEDRGIMFGDILKAYGSDKIYAISPIPSDYTVQPVYDTEVLSQIENLSVYDGIPYAFAQNTNLLQIYTDWKGDNATTPPGTKYMYPLTLMSWVRDVEILNFHQLDVPTPAQIMVATRLKAMGAFGIKPTTSGTSVLLVPKTCGTETISGVDWIQFNYTDNVPSLAVTAMSVNANSTVGITYPMFSAHEAFDWAPWIYYYADTTLPSDVANVKAPSVRNCFGDFDYYTSIDTETLKKMNVTALYSEFGVPVI